MIENVNPVSPPITNDVASENPLKNINHNRDKNTSVANCYSQSDMNDRHNFLVKRAGEQKRNINMVARSWVGTHDLYSQVIK